MCDLASDGEDGNARNAKPKITAETQTTWTYLFGGKPKNIALCYFLFPIDPWHIASPQPSPACIKKHARYLKQLSARLHPAITKHNDDVRIQLNKNYFRIKTSSFHRKRSAQLTPIRESCVASGSLRMKRRKGRLKCSSPTPISGVLAYVIMSLMWFKHSWGQTIEKAYRNFHFFIFRPVEPSIAPLWSAKRAV